MGRNTARYRETNHGAILSTFMSDYSPGSLIGNTRSSSLGSRVIPRIPAYLENCILQCLIAPHSIGYALPRSLNVDPCNSKLISVETVVLDWLAKALGLPETFLSTGH